MAHLAFHPISTVGLFHQGGKLPEHEANDSL